MSFYPSRVVFHQKKHNNPEKVVEIIDTIRSTLQMFKAADLQMLKKKRKKKVNTGQVMFSGEIYYY